MNNKELKMLNEFLMKNYNELSEELKLLGEKLCLMVKRNELEEEFSEKFKNIQNSLVQLDMKKGE